MKIEKESDNQKGNNPNTQKIPNYIVNEPIPCVYGPPDWYKKNRDSNRNNRNSDKNHSFVETLKRMIQQIKNIKHNMSNILLTSL